MEITLEKTFLKIDVLHLEIYFNDPMSEIIEKTYQENQNNFKNLKEKLAPQIINTPYALAKIKFLRTIKLNQFLNGVKSNLKLALDQNYISEEIYQEISNNLPHWYSFLKDRKILENDMMYYQIYPNYIRIIYQSSDGKILLDQKDFGEQRRKSILASYFADGSEFQEGLIQSLKK